MEKFTVKLENIYLNFRVKKDGDMVGSISKNQPKYEMLPGKAGLLISEWDSEGNGRETWYETDEKEIEYFLLSSKKKELMKWHYRDVHNCFGKVVRKDLTWDLDITVKNDNGEDVFIKVYSKKGQYLLCEII